MHTTSPTMELILMSAGTTGRDAGGGLPPSEVERLRADNEMLRRKLAHITAQYIWAEGGSFARIDQEIRQYGYRLADMRNGQDPRIVPVAGDGAAGGAAGAAQTTPSRRVAGTDSSQWSDQ